MDGILNIYKAQGLTSHDVVQKARRILNEKKIGHTGTLDPIAEGVLPLTVGRATKISQFIVDKEKEYIAEMYLGIKTDTYDRTGKVIGENKCTVDKGDFLKALCAFNGDIQQVPPIYSAIKVNGKKLYQYARKEESVSVLPRKVHISKIDLIDFDFPIAKIKVACSKGTYIRSLCNDIGEKLNTFGHMTSLIRTKSGPFNLENSIRLEELENLRKDQIENLLFSMDFPLAHLKKIDVNGRSKKYLINGNTLLQKNISQDISNFSTGEKVRIYFDGNFYGIGRVQVDDYYSVKPVRLFVSS